MPWEKSFDEDAALEQAMKVFWEKGYESASVADLLEGTGLNRGSFYNAYGSKQQLFVKALRKYDRDNRTAMLSQLEAMDNPKQAITDLFDIIVAETVDDPDHKGCFLINTVSEMARQDEEVNEIVANGIREFEAFVRRSIEVAQARGDIPKHLDPETTAKALFALIVAIRVLGRGVFAESALHTIADQGKRLIA